MAEPPRAAHVMSDDNRSDVESISDANDEFIDAVSGSATDKKEKVILKFETWIKSLRELLGYKNVEPRNFSASIKRQLYENDATCSSVRRKFSR